MGNDMVPRIAFRELADVKAMISVLIDGFEATVRAAGMMAQMGIVANAPEATEARNRGREYAELLIATYEEFERLHFDSSEECDCPMTREDVQRAIVQLREILADIKRDDETAEAMPPYQSRNPLEALMSRLGIPADGDGGPGIKVMSADELFGTLGGKPDGVAETKFGTDGTGMYL